MAVCAWGGRKCEEGWLGSDLLPPADSGGSGGDVSGGGGMSSGPGTDKLRDSFMVGGCRKPFSSSATPVTEKRRGRWRKTEHDQGWGGGEREKKNCDRGTAENSLINLHHINDLTSAHNLAPLFAYLFTAKFRQAHILEQFRATNHASN